MLGLATIGVIVIYPRSLAIRLCASREGERRRILLEKEM
jgi:hypothetical protein